ncbi:MAG: GNAT superfamily N-acetyltransferase [Verrucomicrobiales bacterium]|jgi:GNAT superfamily N-acetyltransferase
MSHPSSVPCELISNYAFFNAARSLSTPAPSKCERFRFGSAVAIVDPARPGSPMCNRVLGYDADTISHLPDILSLFEEYGQPPHFDISSDNLFPEVVASLVENDISASQALTYLSLAPAETQPEESSAEVVVESWEEDRADDFLALLRKSGVTCSNDTWKDRHQYYCTDTFRTFVASCDGQPCAWATLYVDGDLGYFANAFTFPDFRKRGAHSALLRARIRDARGLGLKRVFTDVVAGSQSHHNCRRAGFANQTVVTLWKKEG